METNPARADAIRRALERVLSSPGFARNERLSGFLRFLVQKHLEGRDSEIKESVIAHEVFGRQAGYDPKVDPIVRTEAIRLRARLEKYYQAEGSQDPLVIDLPKGGYRPVVRERTIVPPPTDIGPARQATAARVWRVRWVVGALGGLVLAGAASAWWSLRSAEKTFTVGVFPFENVGGDPANEYFADGLTDEIIRNLSLIDGLTVPSRTSSFALKGKGLNAGEAARQLGTEYLVDGAVLHAGDQLRVTVALVRARDDVRLWSDRFDRKLTDVFAIHDEISRGISNTLRLNFTPGRRRYETNLEAYEQYLRGRQIMASFPSGLRPIALPALEHFERAIDKDPSFAIAYAGMADALLAMERNVGTNNPFGATVLSRAKAAADRAVELDPMLSEGHSALASLRGREYAWQDAERGYRHAIELNPNNVLAHLELGASVLVVQGRVDEGLREVHLAVALDPLSPYVNTQAGDALIMAGRYAESAERLRKAIALDPSRARPYRYLGRALTLQGQHAAARAAYEEAIKRGGVATTLPWLACTEVHASGREQAVLLLREQLAAGVRPRVLARTYACLGDEEHTVEYLEKSLADDTSDLAELLQAPELASMRANPRVAALRKRVNLQ